MEKLISSFYCDYNSTSPWAQDVKDFVAQGDFLFANPSSKHKSGRLAAKAVAQSRLFLSKHFSSLDSTHDLFFHSGATEGIYTLLVKSAQNFDRKNKKVTFFYSKTDHLAVLESFKELSLQGHLIKDYQIDKDTGLDLDQLILDIKKAQKNGPVILNWTWVNNETGMVLPLSLLKKIKDQCTILVHVDAVQAVGKIPNWNDLLKDVDAYTFSGHKFGALKGIGFSFYRKDFNFLPLLVGGGQQNGIRGGTENVLGIKSIELALNELTLKFNEKSLLEGKNYFENQLASTFLNKIEIVGKNVLDRNLNTTMIILKNIKSDISLTALDISGIQASSGSACSSGVSGPNRVLQSLGYSAQDASCSIRFSFSPYFNLEESKLLTTKVVKTFTQLLSK